MYVKELKDFLLSNPLADKEKEKLSSDFSKKEDTYLSSNIFDPRKNKDFRAYDSKSLFTSKVSNKYDYGNYKSENLLSKYAQDIYPDTCVELNFVARIIVSQNRIVITERDIKFLRKSVSYCNKAYLIINLNIEKKNVRTFKMHFVTLLFDLKRSTIIYFEPEKVSYDYTYIVNVIMEKTDMKKVENNVKLGIQTPPGKFDPKYRSHAISMYYLLYRTWLPKATHEEVLERAFKNEYERKMISTKYNLFTEHVKIFFRLPAKNSLKNSINRYLNMVYRYAQLSGWLVKTKGNNWITTHYFDSIVVKNTIRIEKMIQKK